MNPAKLPLANENLYRRIDELQMSVTDRELAKSRLRTGEYFADAVCAAAASIRSCASFVARHLRAATAPSAQH